jgi:hypothetical protein
MTVTMRVQGPTVGCTLVGDRENLTHTFIELPRKGGIGIQTWNKHPSNATAEIRSVTIEAL